jgi:hypothetical protein
VELVSQFGKGSAAAVSEQKTLNIEHRTPNMSATLPTTKLVVSVLSS